MVLGLARFSQVQFVGHVGFRDLGWYLLVPDFEFIVVCFSVLFLTVTMGEKHCRHYSANFGVLSFSVRFIFAHCGQWVGELP